jgi:hypothetical protein
MRRELAQLRPSVMFGYPRQESILPGLSCYPAAHASAVGRARRLHEAETAKASTQIRSVTNSPSAWR